MKEVSSDVSVYLNGRSSAAPMGTMSINEALEVIRTGELKIDGKVFRDIKESQKTLWTLSKGTQEYNDFKSLSFPAVTWSIETQGMRKTALEAGGTKSGYAYIDFDGLSEQEAESLKKRIIAYVPCVKAVWKSISGKGLGGIIKLASEDGEAHIRAFLTETAKTRNPADRAIIDVYTRINFLSYDPDVYVRPDSEVEAWDKVEEDAPSKLKRAYGVGAVDISKFNITEQYALVCGKKSIVYASSRGEYNPPNHFHTFSFHYGVMMRNYGIGYDQAITVLHTLMPNFAHDEDVTGAYAERYQHQLGAFLEESVSLEVIKEEAAAGALTIPEGGNLSSLNLTREDVVGKFLVAPTGSGKTWVISKFAGKKVVVVPTKNLSEELQRTYGGGVYNQDNKTVSRAQNIIFVTYASFANLCNEIPMYERDIYLDEAHVLTTNASASFQLAQLNKTVDTLKALQPKSITLVSATPVYISHPFFRDYEMVVVKSSNVKTKKFKYMSSLSSQKAVQDIFADDESTFKAVLLNDTKGKLDGFMNVLSDQNLHVFNAGTKEEEHFVELIKTGNIADDVNGYFCTTVLKEGNSFNFSTPKKVQVIVIGMFSVEEIEQFSARFRNATEIECIIIRPESYCDKMTYFNGAAMEEMLMEYNNEVAKDFFGKAKSYEVLAAYKLMDKMFHIHVDAYTDEYSVDYLGLSNAIFEAEKRAAWGNEAFFIKKMGEYSWVAEEFETNSEALSKEEATKVHKVVQAKKESRRQAELKLLEEIKVSGLENNALTYKSRKSGKDEKKVRQRLNYLFHFEKDEAKCFELYSEYTLSEKAWSDLRSRVTIERVLKSNSKSDSKVREFYEGFKSSFTLGDSYTYSEIKDACEASSKACGLRTTFSERTASTLFSLMFENEVSVVRDGGSTAKAYTPIALTALPFNVDVKLDSAEDAVCPVSGKKLSPIFK